MKQLIVNADDFGLAESINRGIALAHTDGILTSASLLANACAFQHATVLARQLPRLSIGVHLNLSQGKPVSPEIQVSTLLNKKGMLHLAPLPLWIRILTGRVRLEHIECELRAQIRKVFEAGITPTHLDGHLHVHVLPQLSSLLVSIAREFRIQYVRCPVEDVAAALPLLWSTTGPGIAAMKRSAISYAVSSFGESLRGQLRAVGLTCSDAFLGLSHTGFLNGKSLLKLLAIVPEGTTELMCHPGYNSRDVTAFGGELTAERESELTALISPEIKHALDMFKIGLTNFHSLKQNPAFAQTR